MRIAPPLLALAVASAASAQSWEFTFSRETLSPENPSTTVTLWATITRPDAALAGAGLDLLASEGGWDGSSLTTLLTHPGQRPGELLPDGRTVSEIAVGQIGGSFHPDPASPLAVWRATFAVSEFTPRDILLTTETERFYVYTDLTPRYPVPEPRVPIDVEVSIRVIPSPGPLAIIAIGALAALRRRAVPDRATPDRRTPPC